LMESLMIGGYMDLFCDKVVIGFVPPFHTIFTNAKGQLVTVGKSEAEQR
jgi:hypothetical protein